MQEQINNPLVPAQPSRLNLLPTIFIEVERLPSSTGELIKGRLSKMQSAEARVQVDTIIE